MRRRFRPVYAGQIFNICSILVCILCVVYILVTTQETSLLVSDGYKLRAEFLWIHHERDCTLHS